MSPLSHIRALVVMAIFALSCGACAAPPTRAQALAALSHSEAAQRLAGVQRLAEIGTMADADRLLGTLADADAHLRIVTTAAVWQIWSRSGDAGIDKLFARGIQQMEESQLENALATFSEIVRRKPAFAEGWNKRATVYFMLGRHAESLKDCDQVLRRNRNHFGALSGAGQIHLQLGHAREALQFFRRAVDVNPALEGPANMIPLLEELLRDKGQKSI
ncbi:MAG: tetratricopeptide repeat protein [Burkholderiaceae bacterium]